MLTETRAILKRPFDRTHISVRTPEDNAVNHSDVNHVENSVYCTIREFAQRPSFKYHDPIHSFTASRTRHVHLFSTHSTMNIRRC